MRSRRFTVRNAGLFSVLAVGLVFFSRQAQALDDDTIADVRCIVVGMRFSGLTDPNLKSAGTMLGLYYVGRIEGRTPKLDIEELLVSEAVKMTSADYGSEAQRCGGSLALKGQELTKIGNDLLKRAQEMRDQATAPPQS
jgi:hypothetical protein